MSTDKSQVMSFFDHSSEWVSEMKSSPDSTFNVAHKADTSLEAWLSRPIKIKTYTWTVSGDSGQLGTSPTDREFNPWTLFLENARVKEKLDYYNLLRCKLRLKFVINGNPFYYGRAMASYTPLFGNDDFHSNTVTSNMGITSVFDICPYSQRQKIFLDPSTSQGGEMILPFIWWSNAFRVPASDWTTMGVVNMFTLAPLLHANSQTQGEVNIQIFAWAEDITLSVPTTNVFTPQMGEIYGPQMGEIYEPQMAEECNAEYHPDGVVSRPMHALSRIAKGFSSAGIFKPYAIATDMVASSLSSLAYSLGFSRPANVQDVQPFNPRFAGDMARTSGADLINKLTMDPKQQTTVDSRVVGLDGKDELSINEIASREAILDVFPWDADDSVRTLLWKAAVTPYVFVKGPETPMNSGNFPWTFPACAAAVLPFRYWRGTLYYRVQVVASAYHKGRLRIIYEPNSLGSSVSDDYNLVYSTIVDLDKTRDFTIPVGWGNQFSMLQRREISLQASQEPYSTSESTLFNENNINSNGELRIEVLNELTSPGTDESSINLVVSLRAGDDFEVFEPNSTTLETLSYFDPQFGEIYDVQAAEIGKQTMTTADENAPHEAEKLDMMAQELQTDNTHLVYFGDPVSSFRQLLRRYNFHQAYKIADTTPGSAIRSFTISDFPQYYGYDPNGEHVVVSPVVSANFCKTTLMSYLTPMFITRRGGIRRKYVYSFTGREGLKSTSVISRVSGTTLRGTTESTQISFNLSDSQVAQGHLVLPMGNEALAVHPIDNNPIIDAELPWYSNYRFTAARNLNCSLSSVFGRNFHNVYTLYDRYESTNSQRNMLAYVAAAEDFTLSGFIGMPRVYVNQRMRPPMV